MQKQAAAPPPTSTCATVHSARCERTNHTKLIYMSIANQCVHNLTFDRYPGGCAHDCPTRSGVWNFRSRSRSVRPVCISHSTPKLQRPLQSIIQYETIPTDLRDVRLQYPNISDKGRRPTRPSHTRPTAHHLIQQDSRSLAVMVHASF